MKSGSENEARRLYLSVVVSPEYFVILCFVELREKGLRIF